MAYPPSTVAANKTSATPIDVGDDHATHHNAVAAGVNDIVAELGTGPKGGSADLTARLSTLDTTVAGKQPLDADLTTIAANITAAGHAILDDADAAAQRTTLGLGSIATQAANAVSISGGSVTGITDLTVADGGTGASTAADARTNLGLVIGTDVQAQDAELSAIAGLTSAADKVPYFTGAGTAGVADFTAAGRALVDDADAAAQRTTLGLGSIATQAASAVSITGGSVTGITDLAVADGGTGASTAADARTNLGLVIGTNVQAQDAELSAIAGLTSAANKVPYFTGSGTAAVADFTGGAWTSYTPQVDQGASTNIAKTVNHAAYSLVGKTCTVAIRLAFTAAGTAGSAITVSLPFAEAITAVNLQAGTGNFYDTSAALRYRFIIQITGGSQIFQMFRTDATANSAIGADPNIAIASTDLLTALVIYQIA